MNTPQNKKVSVHICLLNGKWVAYLYGMKLQKHLKAAMHFCRQRNLREGRIKA